MSINPRTNQIANKHKIKSKKRQKPQKQTESHKLKSNWKSEWSSNVKIAIKKQATWCTGKKKIAVQTNAAKNGLAWRALETKNQKSSEWKHKPKNLKNNKNSAKNKRYKNKKSL